MLQCPDWSDRPGNIERCTRVWRMAGRAGCITLLPLLLAGACVSSSPMELQQRLETTVRSEVIGSRLSGIDARSRHAGALRDAYERAQGLVAAHGVDSLLDHVRLRIVDDALINDEVRRETERLVSAQFRRPDYSRHFVDRVMDAQSGSYAALYVADSHEILVSARALDAFVASLPDARLRRPALLALMIHELVHADDDRRHDIAAVRTLDFRAAFAQSAVFEGHAQWATRQICTRAGCLAGLDALDRFMFGGNEPVDPVVQSSAALSRNVLEYAYVEGERFIDALATRVDGGMAIDALLAAPPLDPIQILAPASWPDAAREHRNRKLMSAARTAAHPWNHTGGLQRSSVATSPLKGVNLRRDPARRAAAIDGFTRLLVAMAALELHDERDAATTPIAVTLLQADSPDTAELFARSLHGNSRARPDLLSETSAVVEGTRLYRTVAPGVQGSTFDSERWPTGIAPRQRTLVAVRDAVVLQIAADGESRELMDHYALATLDALAAAR